ncbi:hypothetical protein H0H87_008819 [Tephrocybe sp. NHM501043]|nr:hypothetical protein H0H87_008819 [Tephrocybe sp. NHM501043]
MGYTKCTMGFTKRWELPKKTKRPSKTAKSIEDAEEIRKKRYFFVTGLSTTLSKEFTPQWVPRPEWETLTSQERLLLKNYIPHDLPYNASLRTIVPELSVERERHLPAVQEGVAPPNLAVSAGVPTHSASKHTFKARDMPIQTVSAPTAKARETWREIKKEDRENETWNLTEQPTWIAAKEGMVTCPVCNTTFTKKGSFTRHYNTHHNRSIRVAKVKEEEAVVFETTLSGEIKCGRCGQTFRRKAGFDGHWRRQHEVKLEALDDVVCKELPTAPRKNRRGTKRKS